MLKLVVSLSLVLFVLYSVFPISANSSQSQKSQKVIDFEDQLVEGVNKRPLDSLSQIGEKNRKKKKPHLYRKRTGFRSETAETLNLMRYSQ